MRTINLPEYFGVKVKFLHIIILLVAVIGIIMSVFLVTRQQIFKSKATVNLSGAFEITDDKGNIIQCIENVCPVKSLKLNIKVVDPSLLEE